MKRVAAVLLVCSIAASGCRAPEATENANPRPDEPKPSAVGTAGITMYHFNVPPIIFEDESGRLTGALYDYIEEDLSPAMGVVFNWVRESTPIPREIEILQTDPQAAAAPLVHAEERATILAFTKAPYFVDVPALVVRKTSPLTHVDSVEDILGLTIGYALGGFLSPMMQDNRLTFDLNSNSDYHRANLIKLDLGRVDAVYAPGRTVLALTIQKLNMVETTRIINLPDVRSRQYVVFSKLAPELVAKYNDAFDRIGGANAFREKLSRYVDPALLESNP